MIAVVLVNDGDFLGRACAELSGFLHSHRSRQSSRRVPDTVLGLWVETNPDLECRDVVVCDSSTGRFVRTSQSLGMSGIWTLLYYDTAYLARVDVLDALAASVVARDTAAVDASFVPVFREDTPSAVMRSEMEALQAKHARHLSPHLLQCPITGRLFFHATDAAPSKPQ